MQNATNILDLSQCTVIELMYHSVVLKVSGLMASAISGGITLLHRSCASRVGVLKYCATDIRTRHHSDVKPYRIIICIYITHTIFITLSI